MASGFFRILSPNVFFGAVSELWKNGKWSQSKVFGVVTGFAAISCPAVSRCFADGYANAVVPGYDTPMIKTWNGRKWTAQHPAQAAAAYPAGNFSQLSCVSQSLCEAVGDRFDPNVANSELTLPENWNGHHWVVQTTPNP
jgi:hypothetical protein